MVPNFLYTVTDHLFNIIIIIIIMIIRIFLPPTHFWLGGKATEPTIFFNISKKNLFNILFHRGDFVKDRK